MGVFLKILFFFGVWSLLIQVVNLSGYDIPAVIKDSPVYSELFVQGIGFAAMLVVTLLFAWLIDGGKSRSPITKRFLRDTALGIIVGVLLAGGAAGLITMVGSISYVVNPQTADVLWQTYLLWAAAILINVITQEYILRAYMFSLLKRKYGAIAAVVVPAVLSLLVQGEAFTGGAMPVLNALAFSILFGMMRLYTRGMLAPIIAHFIWSASGCLIFGQVSLGAGYPSYLTGEAAGSAVISGGNFGFVGSALTLLAVCLLIDLISILAEDERHPENAILRKKERDNKDASGATVTA
jgi:membrane protease YdiL (CAAX protease family)